MTDPIERIAVAFEAFDQRLSAIDNRFTRMEGHLADDAQATDETSQAVANLAGSMRQMQLAIVEIADEMKRNNDIIQNFITETQRLRTSSQQLISEVRKRA